MQRERIQDSIVGTVAGLAFVLLLFESTAAADPYREAIGLVNLGLNGLFLADAVLRLPFGRGIVAHLRKHWVDFIVFIPLLQFLYGRGESPGAVIARQFVIVVVLVSRTRKFRRLLSVLSLRAAQAMVLSFVGTAAVGTVLLCQPAAVVGGERMAFTDAFFTATSAVCVTGLIVQDTAVYFTRFGQLVILGLIQAGGLGIMTYSVFLALVLGKGVDVRKTAVMQELMDQDTLVDVRRLLGFIVTMTFALEFAGALSLFLTWREAIPHPGLRAYHAAFHAISAFCNAGFSTYSDSLSGYRDNISATVTVMLLITFGGIGFTVIRDLWRTGASRLDRNPAVFRLRVQTRIVLLTSVLLTFGGAALLALFEWHTSLADAELRTRVLVPLFQSVSARTAGFNTVDIGAMSAAGRFMLIILMFIGASPGSTGGGIKTTTLAVLCAAVADMLRQQEEVRMLRRTIPTELIRKAALVVLLSLVIVAVFSLALLHTEGGPVGPIVFETVSAFGTVGLSEGITGDLSRTGKVLVTILMFIGRLGPLTLAYSFLKVRRAPDFVYAEERVMIG